MKRIALISLVICMFSICGCSTEKAPESQQQDVPQFKLSQADKEKLVKFQKEILNMESITDKAIKLAGNELKNFIKSGEPSMSMSGVLDRTKAECKRAAELLAKKTIPETLPPDVKNYLTKGRTDLIAAYGAYAESYDAIRRFVTDKNPMALLEYRKKSSQAQELYNGATEKFKMIIGAAGEKK